MAEKAQIIEIVYEVVDEINQLLEGEKLKKAFETTLFGESGRLDSLELINFIVATEELIEKRLGIGLTISEGLAKEFENSGENHPFRTLGSIIDYVYQHVMLEVNNE
jgi:acyl carrier protein